MLVQLGGGYVAGNMAAAVAYVGGMAGGVGSAVAGLALAPAYIVATVVKNYSSRHNIETEFARRRLMLPVTLAPGATAQGSLFFRISPGPRQLALHSRAADQVHDSIIDLTPLSGLHLAKRPADSPAAADSPSPPEAK